MYFTFEACSRYCFRQLCDICRPIDSTLNPSLDEPIPVVGRVHAQRIVDVPQPEVRTRTSFFLDLTSRCEPTYQSARQTHGYLPKQSGEARFSDYLDGTKGQRYVGIRGWLAFHHHSQAAQFAPLEVDDVRQCPMYGIDHLTRGNDATFVRLGKTRVGGVGET